MNASAVTALATVAATFTAFYAAHQVGDHWIQTGHQAAVKARPGWVGRLADARHVATLTATKLLFLGVLLLVTGATVTVWQVAVAMVVDAVSHWWADRRTTLAALAESTGIGAFYRLGAPRPGGDDNPSLGTGAYALDQSWHVAWLFVAALIVAA